jgi:gamma-glutamyl-gamma-aminobutyrate hydrolase PuuD
LLCYAAERRLPLLGICRGMQMLAHSVGTGLQVARNHVCSRHVLHGEICGTANSFHNFALTDCPRGYRVLAKSEDGHIEAIVHKQLPWEGWMWHPERETPFISRDIERIRRLFSG